MVEAAIIKRVKLHIKSNSGTRFSVAKKAISGTQVRISRGSGTQVSETKFTTAISRLQAKHEIIYVKGKTLYKRINRRSVPNYDKLSAAFRENSKRHESQSVLVDISDVKKLATIFKPGNKIIGDIISDFKSYNNPSFSHTLDTLRVTFPDAFTQEQLVLLWPHEFNAEEE